jgi:hypothetical protein
MVRLVQLARRALGSSASQDKSGQVLKWHLLALHLTATAELLQCRVCREVQPPTGQQPCVNSGYLIHSQVDPGVHVIVSCILASSLCVLLHNPVVQALPRSMLPCHVLECIQWSTTLAHPTETSIHSGRSMQGCRRDAYALNLTACLSCALRCRQPNTILPCPAFA